MMKIRYLISTLFIFANFVFPQEALPLIGDLNSDSYLILNKYQDNAVNQNSFESSTDKKSVVFAGVLSGIIPGAEEVYVGGTTNYIKAGALFLIEATSIYYSISYNQRGDAQTNFFQNFADQRWSVVRYAQWINDNTNGVKVTIDPNTSLFPWKRINWDNLNAAENAIGAIGFSHNLPPHGEQSYYEVIGKYSQFARGWADDNQLSNPDYITSEFHWYALMRGDANDLYKVSARSTAILYVNHLLSILDAIWSSVSFNKNLALNVSYDRVNMDFIENWTPTLHITYCF